MAGILLLMLAQQSPLFLRIVECCVRAVVHDIVNIDYDEFLSMAREIVAGTASCVRTEWPTSYQDVDRMSVLLSSDQHRYETQLRFLCHSAALALDGRCGINESDSFTVAVRDAVGVVLEWSGKTENVSQECAEYYDYLRRTLSGGLMDTCAHS